jgi:hypothetical protein
MRATGATVRGRLLHTRLRGFLSVFQLVVDPTKGDSLMKRFLSSCARLPRVVISIGLGLTALAPLGHTAAYAGTVYSISNSLSGTSVQNGWTIAGTIELQDTTAFGAITASDIKSWSWTASKPGNSDVSASSPGYTNLFSYPAGGITATATGLYYKTNLDININLADADFNVSLYWGANSTNVPSSFQATDYTSPQSELFSVAPADLPTDATYGYRFATPSAVPEPSTCASVLAGLACGGYSLFRRRRAC